MKTLFSLFSVIALAGRLLAQSPAVEPADGTAGEAEALLVEKEYQALLEADDAAQSEVDDWIQAGQKPGGADDGVYSAVLRARVRQRLNQVRERYEAFLTAHPSHSEARLAFGSFLVDIQEPEAGLVQMEKARDLDPKNAAAWNNLANYYGHNGPVTNAFIYYAKAIELEPTESVYYYNFATTVYLFRAAATNHYNIPVEEVFDKAMKLYHRARELDPTNFLLASEVAQTYYGIILPKTLTGEARAKAEKERAEAALAAWDVAMKLARDDIERQGVRIHLARNLLNAGRPDEAMKQLDQVTGEMFEKTKRMLVGRVDMEKAGAKE